MHVGVPPSRVYTHEYSLTSPLWCARKRQLSVQLRCQSALNPREIRAKSAYESPSGPQFVRVWFVSCGLDAVGLCRALSAVRLSGASRAECSTADRTLLHISALKGTRGYSEGTQGYSRGTRGVLTWGTLGTQRAECSTADRTLLHISHPAGTNSRVRVLRACVNMCAACVCVCVHLRVCACLCYSGRLLGCSGS